MRGEKQVTQEHCLPILVRRRIACKNCPVTSSPSHLLREGFYCISNRELKDSFDARPCLPPDVIS